MKTKYLITALLAIHLAIASGQGYGNIEDDSDSSPQKPIPPSQQISSLPQYESNPPQSSSNLQSNPSPQTVDQTQDYWWMNQNAFQKPAGHPGVEQLGQSAPEPAPAQPKPQGNRNPNAYNPQSPSQNTYQQQQPQKPQSASYKPQSSNQFQQNAPAFGAPSSPSSSGFGWQAPSPGGQAPPAPPPPQGARPVAPNNFQPQQQPSEAFNLPSQGYNPPPPVQQVQPQPRPQPYQPLPLSPEPQPAGFYQPPQPQKPNPYENRPQNLPSNQNNQPQFQPDSQPASSFQLGPRPNSYQPQQQQYNKPAPTQPSYNNPPQSPPRPYNNEQQFQNNAQGSRPNNQQQQQPQNYDDQLPYPGCPAAMLCVNENRCNLIGIIEEAPIGLSESEKAHRVALSRCSEPGTGVEGICCRDPNYKDPWPDMQGQGGGDHQHHHPDKGQGQGQSPTAFQPNFQSQSQSQPSNNFKNPYAALRKNITTPRESSHKTEFHSCLFGEACVIAYKCQEGFLKSSQDKKPIEHDKGDSNKNVKKCKEDIFKNAFVCCKIGTQPSKINVPLTTTSTTPRPRPVTIGSVTKEPIYKNNYFLTNTLAPTPTTFEIEASEDVTESSLITGLGLRFHSHLHTKSAIRANAAKPNPYTGGSSAIIPIYSDEQPEQLDVVNLSLNNSSKLNSGNFSENSSNSIELLGLASVQKSINETTTVLLVHEKPDDNNTNLTAQTGMNENTTLIANSTIGTYSKPDVNKIPENVPLSEEYSTYPPVGFIFKGDDLYIPEIVSIPAQHFLPPSKEFGAKGYEVVMKEEAVGITDDELAETTTTVSDIELNG